MAPITEEIVYRCCVCVTLLASSFSFSSILFLSPFFFALAHAHHLLNHMKARQMPFKQALVAVVFQLSYTSIFGTLAVFLFIRTGHIIAPIVCHMLCNVFGFPSLSWTSPHGHHYTHRYKIGALFVIGLLSFIALLSPLTSSYFFDSFYMSLLSQHNDNKQTI